MDRIGKHGLVELHDGGTAMFQVVASADSASMSEEIAEMAKTQQFKYGESMYYGDYTIAAWGEYNLLPQETIGMTRKNPYLPEILKKQSRMMYGNGPYLYKTKESEEDSKTVRVPVTEKYKRVKKWWQSWEKLGLPSVFMYLSQRISDYFYIEGAASEYHFNASRKTGGKYHIPIKGLKHVPIQKCRLAFRGKMGNTDTITDEMCDKVLVNRWDYPYRYDADEWDRFDPANPFKSNTVINITADKAAGEDIYPIPTSYFGLKEWIKAANLDPSYINSFLKNSLSAKIHVKIPDAWIKSKIDELKKVINLNRELDQDGKEIVTKWEGLAIKTTLDYGLINRLIARKIQDATSVLSGEGKNQGKAFWSRTFLTQHGVEEWKFEEIPVKYKEFIESILKVDERALKAILAGKGMDPAISNVSNEGVFNSGSQVYYAYLVYLQTQPYAETFIMEDLNRVARINFPELEENDVYIGLNWNVPERQQEVEPQNRMDKQK
ncbi:MAG: hypothetical protein N4A59_16380 [Marinifilum sp.]|jgi:hypothetical protein|nr:hypothetical protein [Marinifilum sp.]